MFFCFICRRFLTHEDMDGAAVVAGIIEFQNVFQTLSTLMLVDYLFPEQAELKDGDEFDFLIVGGGTAGCVMANRLAAANFTVLVLEAGDIKPYEAFLPGALIYLPRSKVDWNYTAVEDGFTGKCHRSPTVNLTMGRALGGSSSTNFMLASRGIVNDYQKWAHAANDPSWEFRNLLPYFKRSERLQAPAIANSSVGSCRGVGGVPPDYGETGGAGNIGIAQDNSTYIPNFLKAFEEMGNEIVKDLSGRHSVGYARGLETIAEGYRQSTAYGYLVPASRYPNLFVSKNTIVTRIVFDRRKNAIGVEASINDNKPIFLRAKKEVIISAGAIKSPQLLMLSGIGPKKHLRDKRIKVISELPVGENFQDPVAVTVIHKAQEIVEPEALDLQDYPASVVVGYKSLEACAGIPDYATITFIVEKPSYVLAYCSFPFNFQYEICEKAAEEVDGRLATYTQVIGYYPLSRGKVLLNTQNPFDEPLVYTGQFTNTTDLKLMVEYIKDFIGIQNTSYFQGAGGGRVNQIGDKCKEFEYGTDKYWECYALCMSTSMWNYGGTCAMGSVVDSKLKVMGVQKLRVVDASVMPTVIPGGNYVPTIVIAEKASDMIKEEHTPKNIEKYTKKCHKRA